MKNLESSLYSETPLVAPPEECTRDTLWQGKLSFWQPSRASLGYRFNLDPVLLAGFVQTALPLKPLAHTVDLGAGAGILGILLLALGLTKQVSAVEIQPSLVTLLERNALANGFAERLQVYAQDLRHFATSLAALSAADVEHVIFNPPYYPLSKAERQIYLGALKASETALWPPGKHLGKREYLATLADFVQAAATLVTDHGYIHAIIPANRLLELEQLLQREGVQLRRLRKVRARVGEPVKRVLIQAVKGSARATGVFEDPDLIVHTAGQEYSDEVQAWLQGKLDSGPPGPSGPSATSLTGVQVVALARS